jgi:hypothetical protein
VANITALPAHVPPAARQLAQQSNQPVMQITLWTRKRLIRYGVPARYVSVPLSYHPKVYFCDREGFVLDTLPMIYWGAVPLRPGFIPYHGTGTQYYGIYLSIARPFDHGGKPGHHDIKGYDLREAQPDLCLKLEGETLGGEVWRSNAAPIPRELVSAALATATH